MIFAVYDYVRYRRRVGPYARNSRASFMAAAWQEEIPAHVLKLLEDGDIIFMQDFGWVPSWLIMYATSTPVSHVGSYLSGDRIAHMTTGGFSIDPISSLF